jgi:hypothetical protein
LCCGGKFPIGLLEKMTDFTPGASLSIDRKEVSKKKRKEKRKERRF